MRVDCEQVRALQTALRKINRTAFNDLEFYENGVKLNIDEEVKKEFLFTGLNNTDFVLCEFWKKKK